MIEMSAEKIPIPLLLDGLKETMNICMGQAATSLSELFGNPVAITVPRLTSNLLQFIDELHGKEIIVISVAIRGDAEGELYLVFTKPDALTISNLIIGDNDELGENNELDDLKKSVLSEIGNIVLSNFLDSMSEFTKAFFLHEVPKLFVGEKIKPLLYTNPSKGEKRNGFLLRSAFEVGSTIVEGHIILFPEQNLSDILLKNIRDMLS